VQVRVGAFVILEDDLDQAVAVQPELVGAVKTAPKSLGREEPCCDLWLAFTGTSIRVKGSLERVLARLNGDN
jgi:hypothetical protein